MFRVDWIERYLSRVSPWQVVAVWVPIVASFLWRAFRDPALGTARASAWVLGGLCFWTLLEYALHRWFFHFEPDPASEFQKDLSFLVHGVHHDWPHDADRLVMPPVVAGLLALLVGVPLRLALGPHAFPGFFAGLLAGYLWYDLTHYALHHVKPRTALGEALRRNHLLHHFKTPGCRYGVTTPLWDLVLGTMPRGERAAEAEG
jgi:sterol desaturase/sphingolipid hydroxylase (fatty acid hydroxylase superfamily)